MLPSFFSRFWRRTVATTSKPADLLIVSDSLPHYDRDSGGLRLDMIIRQFRMQGRQIAYGTHQDEPGAIGSSGGPANYARYVDRLASLGIGTILHGEADLVAFLRDHGSDLKDAFLSFPHVGQLVIPMLRYRASHCRIGYDMVDFHALRMQRGAEISGDATDRAEAAKMALIERNLFEAADVVFAVSAAERCAVLAEVSTDVRVLPNAFDIRRTKPPDATDRSGIVFIGGYWHVPNQDAVRWFVGEVWPLIRDARPQAELRLAGSNMTDEITSLDGRDGIVALGYVADIDAFYDRARVSIAPLRYGAGMKGKVGQALAYGLPVVTTSIGAEGMDIVDGGQALIADDAQGFAAAVIRLLDDDALWMRLSVEGPRLVEQTLSTAALGQTLLAAYPTAHTRLS